MAFQTQTARENRKILLEDLQLKKLQLLKQGVVPLTSTPLAISSVPGNAPSPGSEHLSSVQRGAVIQAQASFGFFVPQDSLFGNVILPVLPRYDIKP
ncbi:SOSS complex subunit C homolog [Macrosteles quadrilineatus]|uniref:SOSS complex subunit C homolog n=1 Tax=Macrosteles quadrilineatus TaxID=74068 RepID=UPI0023E25132|nr:SOSS complex subunit C homolog [Macrosteles quadrilineatus]